MIPIHSVYVILQSPDHQGPPDPLKAYDLAKLQNGTKYLKLAIDDQTKLPFAFDIHIYMLAAQVDRFQNILRSPRK